MTVQVLRTPPEWQQLEQDSWNVRLVELRQISDEDWERMARERNG